MKLIKEHLAQRGAMEIRIVTVYIKPSSIIKPDHCVIETWKWIVFRWEIIEMVRNIVQQTRKRET